LPGSSCSQDRSVQRPTGRTFDPQFPRRRVLLLPCQPRYTTRGLPLLTTAGAADARGSPQFSAFNSASVRYRRLEPIVVRPGDPEPLITVMAIHRHRRADRPEAERSQGYHPRPLSSSSTATRCISRKPTSPIGGPFSPIPEGNGRTTSISASGESPGRNHKYSMPVSGGAPPAYTVTNACW
jgi:hypothetical protein